MSKKIKLVGIIFYFLVNVGLRAEIYNYQLVPEEVYTAFHQGLISFQAGKYEQGYVFLERALGRMAEIGVRDLPAYSATLIHLADKIQAQEREKLLTYSRYFAPDCAELYFYRFWYFLDPAHFSLEKAIEEFKGRKDIFSLVYGFISQGISVGGVAIFFYFAFSSFFFSRRFMDDFALGRDFISNIFFTLFQDSLFNFNSVL